MNLAIFGATGKVGQELTKQALEAGHEVTALVRDTSKVEQTHQNLQLKTGDVFDVDDVNRTVKGKDAVIVVLGDGRKGKVRAKGTELVINSMKANGVKRLIVQSTLGAGDSYSTLNFFWKYIMFGLVLRSAFADHEEQERIVRKSGLDWTLVRPGAFTDGLLTGEYKSGEFEQDEDLELKISVADVAHFLLGQIGDEGSIGKAPGLSY
ncbi:MAG: SDR family oxidoreductase [Pyrinomonadaceae bacterium]|nr:SDR family oxidoreductase [Pyrinomonadaceae bacterium]